MTLPWPTSRTRPGGIGLSLRRSHEWGSLSSANGVRAQRPFSKSLGRFEPEVRSRASCQWRKPPLWIPTKSGVLDGEVTITRQI
jgi:hypothetical protein